MLCEEVKKLDNADIIHFHGEQRHMVENHPSWYYQHTWAAIIINRRKFYVDPTSQQFKHIYADIPDFYISEKPPRWYLADRDNIYWKLYRYGPIVKGEERLFSFCLRQFEKLHYKIAGKLKKYKRCFIND